MRRVVVDVACRYYFPPPGIDARGRWAWQRNQHRLYIEIPEVEGEESSTALPVPFFGYNGACPWFLTMGFRSGRLGYLLRSPDGFSLDWQEWRESQLWTQVKFDPFGPYPGDAVEREDWMRGGWWFRYRMPHADNDILSHIVAKLDAIEAYGSTGQEIERLRRDVIMHMLGEPVA